MHKLANAKGYAVKLIPILVVMLLISVFVVIIVGIKAQGKKKKGQYNWLFFMLIALGVPVAATFHTLGYVLISGTLNVLTGRFTGPHIASDKDHYNMYKIKEKGSNGENASNGEKASKGEKARGGANAGVSITNGAVAAAVVATAAATSAVASLTEPKKPTNPLSKTYDSAMGMYKDSIFKTQKGTDPENFNFNKKARRIRKDALWFVLGLGVFTSVLAMLDSSTKIMKSPLANNIIQKTRMVLI